MVQEVCSQAVQALGMGVPVAVGWIRIVNGSGDACTDGESYAMQFGVGLGLAEGRGAPTGYGTGCGSDIVDDRGKGSGRGNAHGEDHDTIPF